ncbi:uncharacterized protein LOC143073475 isoform X2 [Mytilus galloprovincialis]|uniref:uncharacterized protein LOC143073475 isoform X2 n=1 Tax=Mytilus galloprovincialis TaxID=29158 RepID=UPI003F7CC4CA
MSSLIDVWIIFIVLVKSTRCSEIVRLIQANNIGVVQLNHNRSWVILCQGQSENKESKVICQELGHGDGLVLPVGYYGEVGGDYFNGYIKCDQGEDINNCSLIEIDSCKGGYLAVSCYDSVVNGTILSLNNSLSYGQLNWFEDKYQATGQICTSSWDKEEAEVACHQLGYRGGLSTIYPKSNELPFLVNSINCTGQEQNLEDCIRTEDLCESGYSAGVICFNMSGFNVNISDGGVDFGRVNIEVDGKIGTICNKEWSTRDAEVICRYIGFVAGRKWSGPVPPGNGTVYMSDLQCTGKETLITDCPSSGWRNVVDEDCLDHSHDAGVLCYGSVRLSGGETNDNVKMGRVEVYQGRQWTNLCTSKFEQKDATVVCRQLGYARARVLSSGIFGRSPYSGFTTDISCQGNENDILDCPHTIGKCKYSEYASVVCIKHNVTDGMDIRLVGGNLPSQGRVEVARDGVWGTICDNKWSQYDANVVCQQLGFGKGSIHISSYHGRGTGSVLMDSLQCDGTESDIFDCPNLGWEVSDSACKDHSKDAGVSCLPWLPETTSVISSPEPETISSTLTPEQEDLSTTTDISSSTLTTEPESLSSTIAISTESSTLTTELEILSSTIAISTESSTFTPEPESLSSTTDISTISSTIAISTESSTLTTEPEILSSTIAISTESSTFTPEPESLSSTTDISTISSTIAISTESSTLTTEPKGLSSTVDISTEKSTLTTEPEDLSSTIAISTESSTLTTEPENLSSTIAISTISLTTDISTVSSTLTPGPEGLSSTQVSTESSTTELKSLYSSTDISTGSSTVIIGILSKENKNITWLWIVVTVLCLAVVILIIVLIKCRQGYTKRKWQRNSFSQHSFSNANIIRQLSDGSVHAENPLSLHVLEIQGPSQENQDLRANVISDPRYFSIKDNVNPVRHDIDSDGYMVPVSQENRNQPESSHANDKNKIKKNEIHGNAIQNCERCNTAGRHYYSTVAFEGSDRKNMGQVAGTVMDKKHVCPGCIINGDTSFNDSIRTYVSLVGSQIQRRKKDVDQSRKIESAAMNGVCPGSFINGDASFNDSIRTYVSLVDSQTQRKNIDVDQSRDNESPVIDGAVKVDIHQQNGQTKENSEYLTVVPDYSAIGTVSNDFIQSPNNFETKTRDIEDSIVKSSDFQPGSNKKRKNLRDSVKSTLSYQEEIDIEMPEMTTEL